jgi:hypothetical protein
MISFLSPLCIQACIVLRFFNALIASLSCCCAAEVIHLLLQFQCLIYLDIDSIESTGGNVVSELTQCELSLPCCHQSLVTPPF